MRSARTGDYVFWRESSSPARTSFHSRVAWCLATPLPAPGQSARTPPPRSPAPSVAPLVGARSPSLALVLGSAPFADPAHPRRGHPRSRSPRRRSAGRRATAARADVERARLLTLLSVRQHIALLLTLIARSGCSGGGCAVGVMPPTVASPARRAARVAARIGLAAARRSSPCTSAARCCRVPWRRSRWARTILAIDFHAHTRYSHDGRRDWTPEDVRAWHRDAGFDAVYVTDHRTFEGARDGWANNPVLAGQGVSLLPAIEVVWKGEHVNVLDADRMYRGLFNATLRDIDEDALRLASAIPGNEPVLIETLPGDLSRMIPAAGSGTPGVRAIELIDGAPRGLGTGAPRADAHHRPRRQPQPRARGRQQPSRLGTHRVGVDAHASARLARRAAPGARRRDPDRRSGAAGAARRRWWNATSPTPRSGIALPVHGAARRVGHAAHPLAWRSACRGSAGGSPSSCSRA